jgi:hypothetical protein
MSKEAALAQLTPAPAAEASPGLAPAAETIEMPKAPVPLESTRINQLLKKETELQRQREMVKKDQKALAAEKEQWKDLQSTLQQFRDMKQKDPVAALKLAGFSEQDLMAFAGHTADQSTPEQKAAKAAQAEIKKFQDEQAAKEVKVTTERNTQVLAQFRTDIDRTIQGDKTKYEYCNYNGVLARELIYDTVAAVLAESGEIIPISEAAEMVETYYEDTDKAMAAIKKRQARMEASAAPKATEAVLEAAPTRTSVKATLSSKTTATSAPLVAAASVPKKETASQKRERLIQKLGNLGK